MNQKQQFPQSEHNSGMNSSLSTSLSFIFFEEQASF